MKSFAPDLIDIALREDIGDGDVTTDWFVSKDARAAARRAFGNLTRLREETRESWGWAPVERFIEDARFGVRMTEIVMFPIGGVSRMERLLRPAEELWISLVGPLMNILVAAAKSKEARQRLQVLEETTDGFRIAEADLKLRGPGELLGTRQTGLAQMRVADLIRDADLLPRVQRTAELLLADHAPAIQPLLERWVSRGGKRARCSWTGFASGAGT